MDMKWPNLRSPVDRVRVRARVRLGLVSNSISLELFLSIFGQYEHWPKYAVFIWYVALLLCQTTKNCIFHHEFYKKKLLTITVSRQYGCNLIYVQFVCHLTTLPRDMYIHLHTICLTGVTVLGTVTFHFAPNRRRFHWSISRWILLLRKNIFGKSFQSSLSLFVSSFRFFLTFSKHAIIILEGIFHGNRSLTSYVCVPYAYTLLPHPLCYFLSCPAYFQFMHHS